MNDILYSIMDNTCPKVNNDVVNGSIDKILNNVPDFLNKFITSTIRYINPSLGLNYLGYKRVTPEEEISSNLLNKLCIPTYDIAKSDLYPIEFIFEFKDKPIKIRIFLPYSEHGNLFYISNNRYVITPVLTDNVISTTENKVFLRLLKDKITLKSVQRYFLLNGENNIGQIIYGVTAKYYVNSDNDRLGKVVTPVSLYILCKYGFYGALARYCNLTKEDVIITDGDVNQEDFNVFTTTKIKPRGLLNNNYIPHDLKIAIRKDIILDNYICNFIYGILYVFDCLPMFYRDFLTTCGSKEEITLWKILLGRMVFRNSVNVNTMYDDINTHLQNLDSYMDFFTKDKLTCDIINIENFFDLLSVILLNYNTWTIKYKEYNNDLSNKYLDVIYYIVHDIILGFNTAILNLNRRINISGDLSYKEVSKILTKDLKPRKICNIIKAQKTNICISSFDYTSDNKYLKATSLLEDQSRGNGVNRDPKQKLPYNLKTLHAYDLLIGSMLFLGKDSPSPRFKFNIFYNYNINTGRIILNDKVKNIVEKLDLLLNGKIENNGITDLSDDNDDDLS